MNPKDKTTCNACGSSEAERAKYIANNPEDDLTDEFEECNFCGSLKCVMCGMGSDVSCLSCEGEP